VGLAPLYFRLVRRGGVIARSVQLIGLSWRDPEPLISEYLDVIAPPQDVAAVRDECLRALVEEYSWQELVLGLTAAGPQWRSSLAALKLTSGCYVRELDRSISYQANLVGGFEVYLR